MFAYLSNASQLRAEGSEQWSGDWTHETMELGIHIQRSRIQCEAWEFDDFL